MTVAESENDGWQALTGANDSESDEEDEHEHGHETEIRKTAAAQEARKVVGQSKAHSKREGAAVAPGSTQKRKGKVGHRCLPLDEARRGVLYADHSPYKNEHSMRRGK